MMVNRVFFYFVLGVTIMELLVSLFCITSFLVVFQMVFPVLITFVLFQYPILITSSFFMVFIMMILLAWIGFFYGQYKRQIIINTIIRFMHEITQKLDL